MASVTTPPSVDCEGMMHARRNMAIKRLIAAGRPVEIEHPAARHSLAIAIKADVTLEFHGPVGWYAAGMNDGPHVVVRGNCGWGLAECQMGGAVEVHGHAGRAPPRPSAGGSCTSRATPAPGRASP